MMHYLKSFIVLSCCLLAAGCGGSGETPLPGDDQNPNDNDPGTTSDTDPGGDFNALKRTVNCPSQTGDSTSNGGFVTLNTALDSTIPRYGSIASVRKDINDNDISIDYMWHEPDQTPRGLVILIAGGKLNAGIESLDGVNTSRAGTNFLVRSAQFFANAGFRAVTIDRPSDFGQDFDSGDPASAYDKYRTSSRHATDLSSVINATSQDIPDAPVFIAGTSRGAISAVAQQALGAALLLSSPLTSGDGAPISENTANIRVRPASIQLPTQVVWHGDDLCGETAPFRASQLVTDLDSAGVTTQGVEILGGFSDPAQDNPCKANTFHGFLGVESCAVQQMTDWASDALASLPTSRPAISGGDPTQLQTSAGSPFRLRVSAVGAGPFTFSLPHNLTDLLGIVERSSDDEFTYTPPEGLDGTTDSFVYVATDANGGTSSQVIRIRIN